MIVRPLRRRPAALLLPIALVALPATAAAETVTLPATLDATIYADAPDGANAAGEHLTVGTNSQGAERRALVAFDVSSIPAGSTITDVALSLYASRGNGPEVAIALHPVLAAWGEGTSNAGGEEGQAVPATAGDPTWTDRVFDSEAWATAGGDLDPTASATTVVGEVDTPYVWDDPELIVDVQAWVDDVTTNHGWILIAAAAAPGTTRRFDSRTFGDDAREPFLMVEFDAPGGGGGGAGGGGDGTGGEGAGGDGAGGDGGGAGGGGDASTGTGPGGGGAGSGGAPSGDGGSSASSTSSSASSTAATTTTVTTSSAGGGASSADGTTAEGDGCDCSSIPGAPPGSGVGLGALVAAFLAARRRGRTR